jgi:glycosyltransferase involved in cell wall biosynthesis
VPGPRQYEFARRIGYAPEKIISKCLTADTAVFGQVHQQNLAAKQAKYPHTLVYAGRFAAAKGLDQLVEAFNEVKKEIKNDWKLLLIGNGDLPLTANEHTEIRGFMQGNELATECKNWGAFCLPSRREPYGVVIHEFTMAGLPILCSDSVGAADGLVINNYNGFVYHSGDKEHLKQALRNLMGCTDSELVEMGVRGNQLSQVQSPVIAAYSLMSVI